MNQDDFMLLSREELHEAYKKKMKHMLLTYTDDLALSVNQLSSKNSMVEFVDHWVELHTIPPSESWNPEEIKKRFQK